MIHILCKYLHFAMQERTYAFFAISKILIKTFSKVLPLFLCREMPPFLFQSCISETPYDKTLWSAWGIGECRDGPCGLCWVVVNADTYSPCGLCWVVVNADSYSPCGLCWVVVNAETGPVVCVGVW